LTLKQALERLPHEESTYVERAPRAGALGYVVKRETTTKIVSTIRQVLRGEYFLSGPWLWR
jgi:DNA-binding NarL/FixJ family response regulator